MRKLMLLIFTIAFFISSKAQVYFPKFKGDSLYYKLDTALSAFEKVPLYDLYHPRLDSWSNGWWTSEITVMPGYRTINVFIHDSVIEKTYGYRVEIEKFKKSAKAENLAYLKKLQLKYGKTFGEGIYYETPELGMTQSMVALCIGYPNDINTTRTSGLVYEQWVYQSKYDKYSRKYYYFTNGRLKTIQD